MDNAGGAGVLLPFEPGEQHERPETSETRPSYSLASSHPARLLRPPAHKGEAGAEGRRSEKRLCWLQPADCDAIGCAGIWPRFYMLSKFTRTASLYAENDHRLL